MNSFQVPIHRSLQGRIIGSLLLIALITGISLGIIAYSSSRSALRTRVNEQLTSIADLKKEQILIWIEDRRSDVNALASNKLNQQHFTEIISAETPLERKTEFIVFTTDNLLAMHASRVGYERIVFTDIEGTVILSTDSTLISRMVPNYETFENTLASPNKEFIRDIHIEPESGLVVMEFGHVLFALDPLTGENLPDVIGTAIITVAIEETIYPLIRAWPGMGSTGETLLIRADGTETLFLNDLRFEDNTGLDFSVPVSSDNARPAHLSSRGGEGIIETPDYRGVQVLAAYRHIPGIDWGFVAKQDSSEAFEPVSELTRRLAVVTGFVLLAAGIISVLLSRTLTRPLANFLALTRDVAQGRLPFEQELTRDDEIGELSRSFQEMVFSLSQRQQQVSAANEAARSILGTLNIDDVLEKIAYTAVDLTGARYAAVEVMAENGEVQHFLPIGLTEAEQKHLINQHGPKGHGLLGLFSGESNLLRLRDLRTHPKATGFPEGHPPMEHFLSAPIIGRERTLGLLYVTEKTTGDGFSLSDEDAIQNLAAYAAVALENARLFDDVEASYEFTLDGLIAALDARDKETEGHSHRVVAYTLALAQVLKLTNEEITIVRRGALLHDIGKIGIPDSILHKPGPLDEAEWSVMRRHPELGGRILSGINYLEDAARIVLSHHERWDGNGYPNGLKKEAIPLGARIFAVADTFDAITSDRPYRAARTYEIALSEIELGSGTQFDPKVVNAFLQISKDEWDQIRWEALTRYHEGRLASLADMESVQPLPPQLKTLNRMIYRVSGSLDLELVLQEAATATVELLDAAACALFLYDVETDSLTLAAESQLPLELKGPFSQIPVKGFHNEVVVREGRIRVLGDVSEVAAFVELGLHTKQPDLGEYLCVPLKDKHQVNGVLGVFCRRPASYSSFELDLYKTIGEHVGVAIGHARLHESLQSLAQIDELTGAGNRRFLNQNLKRELERSKRYQHNLALILLDTDSFKEYNDLHGHLAGDQVLRELVVLVRQNLRPGDLIARFGGDEFILLLPETDLTGAQDVARRLLYKIEYHDFPEGRLTASIGIAAGNGSSSADDLLAQADQALYAAKKNGRNSVLP
jgi:diguanylate cyclase (GGDEF)-like protein/putative nucleotidyltransferase with HDIG domain